MQVLSLQEYLIEIVLLNKRIIGKILALRKKIWIVLFENQYNYIKIMNIQILYIVFTGYLNKFVLKKITNKYLLIWLLKSHS